jgi:hypothetical protein
MYRVIYSLLLLASLVVSVGGALWAQDDPTTATATCNFDDEKQLVVQYQHVPINLKKSLAQQVPFGKVWAPGGKAMTLFTNTPVQIGTVTVPIGAYTMYVIPGGSRWTLIVSKSTDVSGNYNEEQDLVRVPLDSGELPSPEAAFSLSFAHIAPQQCNIRMDLDKFGHFADILRR